MIFRRCWILLKFCTKLLWILTLSGEPIILGLVCYSFNVAQAKNEVWTETDYLYVGGSYLDAQGEISLKTKGMPRKPLFNQYHERKALFQFTFCVNCIFPMHSIDKNNKEIKESSCNKKLYCYFSIFFCFLLTISWYSFVPSSLYNSWNNGSLKLKFGQ